MAVTQRVKVQVDTNAVENDLKNMFQEYQALPTDLTRLRQLLEAINVTLSQSGQQFTFTPDTTDLSTQLGIVRGRVALMLAGLDSAIGRVNAGLSVQSEVMT